MAPVCLSAFPLSVLGHCSSQRAVAKPVCLCALSPGRHCDLRQADGHAEQPGDACGDHREPLGAKSLAHLFVLCVGPGEIESVHWPVSFSCPHPPILALNNSSFSSRYILIPPTRRSRSCTQAVCVPPFPLPRRSHAFRAVTPHPCHASIFCRNCPSSPPPHSRSSLAPQGPADVSPACVALPAGSSHL